LPLGTFFTISERQEITSAILEGDDEHVVNGLPNIRTFECIEEIFAVHDPKEIKKVCHSFSDFIIVALMDLFLVPQLVKTTQ
jgi:hypothetical protein